MGYGERRCGFNTKHSSTTHRKPSALYCWILEILCCDPEGRRALLRVPSTVGRSVCLCWALSKPKGPKGPPKHLTIPSRLELLCRELPKALAPPHLSILRVGTSQQPNLPPSEARIVLLGTGKDDASLAPRERETIHESRITNPESRQRCRQSCGSSHIPPLPSPEGSWARHTFLPISKREPIPLSLRRAYKIGTFPRRACCRGTSLIRKRPTPRPAIGA